MAVELFHTFDRARDEAAFIERRQANFVLDQGRDDSPDASSSVILGSDGTAREVAQLAKAEDKRRQDNADIQILLASERLSNFEGDLEAQYGENFASNMFADLYEDGLINEDDYKRVMSIEDKDERRKAMAGLIQKGLDDGTITMDDLKEHPWARQWLDLHEETRLEQTRDAELALNGQKSVQDLSVGASGVYKSATVDQDSLDASLNATLETQGAVQQTSAGFSMSLDMGKLS